MSPRETLRRHFEAEEGSFLLKVRCELSWDWVEFRAMTAAMYDVAAEVAGKETIETWIANGFWFCDVWVKDWTSHPNFPRPDQKSYDEALRLLHELAWFLFFVESPYLDDTLMRRAKGLSPDETSGS